MELIPIERINRIIDGANDADRLIQLGTWEFTSSPILFNIITEPSNRSIPETWNSLGWIYQFLKIGVDQYACYQERRIIPRVRNLIHWKTGSEPYLLFARFVPWMKRSRFICYQVDGFPSSL